jgi:PAS domain S-box-containing protein
VFYLFNKQGRFIRWNRNFEQVTEYSAEEISTMTPLGFFSQEQQQLVANEIERSFIKGEAWVEADLLTKNGRTIPFYFTGHRMRMGDEYLLAGVGIDISELKQKERELEDKNAELERFTYAISHDLKSPLVTIKTVLGYLEQDLSRADTERIDQDMAYMLSAADKMGRLLDELLEMSRIGRLSTPPEHVLFGELVGEALSAVAGPLALRGVEVRVGDEVIPLFGDRPRLVEIWQNLVENAVKFMGDESNPCIEIGVERHGRDTVFFVRDNGVGIDPRYQAKVFGLFEKLDPRSEGTGLGLAITKRVVELYRGTIWLESGGPGRGVCFKFTLPGAMEDQGEGESS